MITLLLLSIFLLVSYITYKVSRSLGTPTMKVSEDVKYSFLFIPPVIGIIMALILSGFNWFEPVYRYDRFVTLHVDTVPNYIRKSSNLKNQSIERFSPTDSLMSFGPKEKLYGVTEEGDTVILEGKYNYELAKELGWDSIETSNGYYFKWDEDWRTCINTISVVTLQRPRTYTEYEDIDTADLFAYGPDVIYGWNPEESKYLNYLNGSVMRSRVVILVFRGEGKEIFERQRLFWHGGKFTELVVCVGINRDSTVKWIDSFSGQPSHMISERLNDDLKKGYFNGKLDVNWLAKRLGELIIDEGIWILNMDQVKRFYGIRNVILTSNDIFTLILTYIFLINPLAYVWSRKESNSRNN